MVDDSVLSSVVLIGVAGGSGSGKTTFARMLQANLSENFAGIIAQDSYYRDRSKQFDHDGGKVNFDHPDALEFTLMAEHLGQLYGMVGGADAAPTVSVTKSLAAVESDFSLAMARWKKIKSTDLPALNLQLKGAGIALIELKAEPEPASESENEE